MRHKWTKRAGVGAFLVGALCFGLALADRGSDGLSASARQNLDVMTQNAAGPRPLELAAMEIAKVEPVVMSEQFRVSGELQPINRAVLRSKAAGTVTEVNARAGERVVAGQVLVRFDTGDLAAAVRQHQSNLDAAQAELVRTEQTLERVEQLEKARSEATSARAKAQGLAEQVEIAQTALRDSARAALTLFAACNPRLASEGTHFGWTDRGGVSTMALGRKICLELRPNSADQS